MTIPEFLRSLWAGTYTGSEEEWSTIGCRQVPTCATKKSKGRKKTASCNDWCPKNQKKKFCKKEVSWQCSSSLMILPEVECLAKKFLTKKDSRPLLVLQE